MKPRYRSLPLSLLALPLAVALSACTADAPPPASDQPVGDPVQEVEPVVDPAAVLEVEDQTSEGPTVLARAAATAGGFVVVLGDNGRNVLGFSEVPAGTEPQDIQISLAEEPTEEIDLSARLYADTNGDGLYGDGDLPIDNGEQDDSDDAEVFAGELETFTFQGKPVVNG